MTRRILCFMCSKSIKELSETDTNIAEAAEGLPVINVRYKNNHSAGWLCMGCYKVVVKNEL